MGLIRKNQDERGLHLPSQIPEEAVQLLDGCSAGLGYDSRGRFGLVVPRCFLKPDPDALAEGVSSSDVSLDSSDSECCEFSIPPLPPPDELRALQAWERQRMRESRWPLAADC